MYRLVLVVALTGLMSRTVAGQGTSFTYQGQLKDEGLPVNGSYNLAFKIFDALGGGIQIGPTITRNGVPVTNGLFQQTLDFEAGVFLGAPRWLEVSVNGVPLTPRQALTATPYALYAFDGPGVGLWQASGPDISNTNPGSVGIGIATPQAKLDVRGSLVLDPGASPTLYTAASGESRTAT